MSPRRFVILFVALLVALGGAACSKKDGDDAKAKKPRATTTTEVVLAAAPALAWTVTGVDSQGTAPPGDDVVAAVKATLDTYLVEAVSKPLFSAQPAGDLSAVLSPAAIERLNADPATRATLVDEGMPAATKSITTETATANLWSIAGRDGAPGLFGAQLDLKVHAIGPTVDVTIVRNGEVVLTNDGSGWRIDSFRLRAQRDTAT